MEENKKILITEFIEHFNGLQSDTAKQKYVSSIITRKYVPILEKKYLLQLMCEKSVVEEPVKSIDLVVNKINFIMAILGLYTSIVCERDENDAPKSFEAYDLIKQYDVFKYIAYDIETDLNELISINQEILDTWYATNTSTKAYVNELIETASRRFGITVEVLLDKLTGILEDETKMKKFITVFEKVVKKVK